MPRGSILHLYSSSEIGEAEEHVKERYMVQRFPLLTSSHSRTLSSPTLTHVTNLTHFSFHPLHSFPHQSLSLFSPCRKHLERLCNLPKHLSRPALHPILLECARPQHHHLHAHMSTQSRAAPMRQTALPQRNMPSTLSVETRAGLESAHDASESCPETPPPHATRNPKPETARIVPEAAQIQKGLQGRG